MASQVTITLLLLATLTAGIAHTKNRNAILWFLGTLIFGPLALICVFFCDKVEE